MPYAVAQDMHDRYPEKDLRELTDENAVAIDDSKLTLALADASAVMDGYLRGRYVLPMVNVPQELVVIACTIAMYNLQQLRPQNMIEDAEKRYTAAIAYLKDVARGTVQLGVTAVGGEPVQSDGPIVVTPTQAQTFTRDTLKVF